MTSMVARLIDTRLIGGAVLLALSAPVAAQQAPDARAVGAAATNVDVAGLESFVDGVMASHLLNREVAGAVIALVADGKIIFKKGYGFADIEKRIPVDPDRTLFRPGSVSKLLTWTALMQQVELGRVDLDEDVNRYLDFKIPDTFAQPIRVRDLLNHSAGFEDSYVGMNAKTPADFVALGPWLASHIPARVRPPGTEMAYSNYGSAIAGYIVERVSGEDFPSYIERHILSPLGMANSTFREPLPTEWSQQMAKGYALVDGQFVARPFEYYHNVMPAGSMSATATDMMRFAIAHLQDGSYGDARILKPETAKLMHTRLLANAPSLPGMAHGFIETRAAGPRIIGHGGNTQDFHSSLMLVPEAKIGFFISTTGGDQSSLARSELVELMLQRLFPEPRVQRWAGAPGQVPEGRYRTNRRTYSDPVKAADLSNAFTVKRHGEYGVVTQMRDDAVYWEQIGPRLYQQVTGGTSMGPLGRMEFQGEGDDARLSFGAQPYLLYRIVSPTAVTPISGSAIPSPSGPMAESIGRSPAK